MAFTVLHTADLHLGKSFSQLPPERAEQRRADLLATLTRLCRLARASHVDLLCIAGDLFDHPTPAMPALAAARQALHEAEVPVLLVPGNHDPLQTGSPYLDAHWPSNVLVAAQSGWQRLAITDYEVWAFGYARGAAHDSPWATFPGCGRKALLALHAACLAPGLAADANYHPFTPTEIPPCSYLALGHHHRAVQVSRTPVAWYAGTPEPLEAEVTVAQALRVTLDAGGANVTPVDVATRRHRLVTVDVAGLSADAIWDRALAAASADDLLTLRVVGMLEMSASLDLPALRAELSARCFAVELDSAAVLLPDAISGEGMFAVLQEVAQARAAQGDAAERARVARAVRYAALALEGRL
ncbi:MAG TPA: DNA repair exonuclease [Armatimonadota bacterium]|jgi:DNA repair exonuclease SbcCD nuclease subunit